MVHLSLTFFEIVLPKPQTALWELKSLRTFEGVFPPELKSPETDLTSQSTQEGTNIHK